MALDQLIESSLIPAVKAGHQASIVHGASVAPVAEALPCSSHVWCRDPEEKFDPLPERVSRQESARRSLSCLLTRFFRLEGERAEERVVLVGRAPRLQEALVLVLGAEAVAG